METSYEPNLLHKLQIPYSNNRTTPIQSFGERSLTHHHQISQYTCFLLSLQQMPQSYFILYSSIIFIISHHILPFVLINTIHNQSHHCNLMKSKLFNFHNNFLAISFQVGFKPKTLCSFVKRCTRFLPPPTCNNKLEKSTSTFHIVPKRRMKGPREKLKQICQMCTKKSCIKKKRHYTSQNRCLKYGIVCSTITIPCILTSYHVFQIVQVKK